MGGCRCIFRDCTVSTVRNPQMHFFHFPVKNKSLIAEWVKMAGVEYLLQLPVEQQRNRVICGRHFREECFMNYKKNSLIANNPVPTLMRLNRFVALDYAQCSADGTPRVIALEKTKMPHLIPPPGYQCTLGLDDDEVVIDDIKVLSVEEREVEICMPMALTAEELGDEINLLTNAEEKEDSINLPKALVEKSGISIDITNSKKRLAPENELKTNKKIKILNEEYARSATKLPSSTTSSSFSLANMQQNSIRISQQNQLHANTIDCDDDSIYDDENLIEIQEYTEDEMEDNEENNYAPYKSNQAKENEAECKKLRLQLNKERSDHCAAVNNMKKLELALANAIRPVNTKPLELETKNAELKKLTEVNVKLNKKNQELLQTNSQLERERKTLTDKCEQWDAKYLQLEKTYALLQEKCTKLETKKQQQQQVTVISTSKESLPIADTAATKSNNLLSSASSTSSSTPRLTKAQLFNGITKYLSSSMNALVRMEMFGNAEREWRKDERRAAVDLLHLGERVYTYLTDEWRFRLPALRQARDWLNETIPEDEEDL